MTDEKKQALTALCRDTRRRIIDMLYAAQSGHPGGSLSCVEILVMLYFEHMQLRPQTPHWPDRDRLFLSKGHAAPALYAVLAERGFFSLDLLRTLRKPDSLLQGHPNASLTPGVDITSGPLGLGLSFAVGSCLAARLSKKDYMNYVILGDGELQEGIIWEAVMSAAKYRCDHLVAIVDWNGVQLDGTNDEIMPLGDIKEKFSASGWRVLSCDGHDVSALDQALFQARLGDGRPNVIFARTVKGKGVSFMENTNLWHGKVLDEAAHQQAVREIEGGALA